MDSNKTFEPTEGMRTEFGGDGYTDTDGKGCANDKDGVVEKVQVKDSGEKKELVGETKIPPPPKKNQSWTYLYVPSAKMERTNRALQRHFPTFVHKEVVYRLVNKKMKKVTTFTIPGLLFVQGDGQEISLYLKNTFGDLFLKRDCMTHKIAVIPNHKMRLFMRISELDVTRIRFMPHDFDYYAEGNALVKITSGALRGMEGYRIRIARDRCFITTLGGMTISISGVHKETFENVEEYVCHRKLQVKELVEEDAHALSPKIREMDKFFFLPENELDALVIANGCVRYLEQIGQMAENRAMDEAIEMALYMLEKIGVGFSSLAYDGLQDAYQQIKALVEQTNDLLLSLVERADASEEVQENIVASLSSLRLRFPLLGLRV